MSTVTIHLRLRTPEDLFRTPDLDPFSEWYEVYSDRAAIEYVTARVGDDPGTEHVQLVIGLPRDTVHEDTEQRVRTAIARYCDARLAQVSRDTARNNARGWLMLAFTIVVVSFFVWTSHHLDDSSIEPLSIAAEGLSIAAWVLLWHPLEALVFNRWDYRLDRRVLRTVRDKAKLEIEALDISAER